MVIKEYDHNEMKKEIQKKMKEFKAFCAEFDIPMFMTVALKNTDKETEYLSEMVDPVLMGIDLTDDHIHEYLKILKGFRVQ